MTFLTHASKQTYVNILNNKFAEKHSGLSILWNFAKGIDKLYVFLYTELWWWICILLVLKHNQVLWIRYVVKWVQHFSARQFLQCFGILTNYIKIILDCMPHVTFLGANDL